VRLEEKRAGWALLQAAGSVHCVAGDAAVALLGAQAEASGAGVDAGSAHPEQLDCGVGWAGEQTSAIVEVVRGVTACANDSRVDIDTRLASTRATIASTIVFVL
jgi:hypothetical protein